ncbi:hypothetical protein [Escherichia sp. E1130]|uniref:hypothetical protein n=1 Tax=Escherichia sp. E1130 TaxID=2041645 RepID=UPI001F0DAB26|nr:hypothetical protein [Escherichia sp. E1130]
MHRIDTSTAQTDKFGPGKNGFTNGDPATGRRATDLNSDMWDAVQEEICSVIEKSGIALNKSQHDQLYEAIVQLITNAVPDALLRKNNLSDLVDKSVARANLELKTAAIRDVQTSKDDVTTGRVLVNGNALALRSAFANGAINSAITDTNNLPANSVSFVYASAAHSPGYEASVLDYAGLGGDYNVQLAASYSTPGIFKFRTKNGDVKTWSDWSSFITSFGGSVDYLDNARYYKTRANFWQGAGGFAGQYTNPTAPFCTGFPFTTPKGVSQYQPICKGVTQTDFYGFGSAVSFGALRSGQADFGQAVIQIIGDNGQSAEFYFDIGSNLSFPGQVRPGSFSNFDERYIMRDSVSYAGFASNNESLPYMRNANSGNVVYLARQDWASSNFVSSIQLGAAASVGGVNISGSAYINVPAGCVITGLTDSGKEDSLIDNIDYATYKPIQKYINNAWVTISG